MSALLAFALATTLATQGAPATPPCPDGTTIDNNQCFSDRLAKANAELGRYLAAARTRLKQEAASDAGAASAQRDFEGAEKAWSAYRDAECGAVYDYWSAGTIGDIETLDCQIRLTQLHAHTIWLQWLTYMDSTPPILPEPSVPPDE